MKCICGYYHLEDWKIENEDIVFQDELRKNNGTEKFKEIYGTFLIKGSDYYETKHEISIYACPKCGTLKIEI